MSMPEARPEPQDLEEKALQEYERQTGESWLGLSEIMRDLWRAYVRNGYQLPPR